MYLELIQYSVIRSLGNYTKLNPTSIFISLTAKCNLRCKGCLYGRDFMNGHELSLFAIKELIMDAKNCGIQVVRLYGGEPLLHPDIIEIVKFIADLKMEMWLNTNGLLLKKKVDELYNAGLKKIVIGCYGVNNEYDEYVGRKNSFSLFEESIRYVREKYGKKICMSLNWLLMKPTCNKKAVRELLSLSKKYEMSVFVNLIHYSLPYFIKQSLSLHLNEDDSDHIKDAITELIQFKKEYPALMQNSIMGLKSIPDWLLKGANMKVPCTENRLLWVGADGTLQVCYVLFKLGNINVTPLKDLLFTKQHKDFAKKVFNLKCPNCYCSYDKRIQVHWPSRKYYSKLDPILFAN